MKRTPSWLAVILVVVAVGGSGCSSSKEVGTASAAGATSAPSAASEAEQANGDCTSALTGHEVRVTIYGSGVKGCEEWDVGAAKASNEYWKPTSEEPRGAPV